MDLAVLFSAHDIFMSDSDVALATHSLATKLLFVSKMEYIFPFSPCGTTDSNVDSKVIIAGGLHSLAITELLISLSPRCWSKDDAISSSKEEFALAV